jgi:H+/Cl- antiporter ClcA
VLAGTASAFFLIALDWATDTRTRLPWLLALLPLAGLAVGWIYHRWGQSVEAGNNLLIDEIHDPRAVVPLRMAPLVLGGTLVSHLFGASVGREGTAVQMGGALAGAMFGLEVLAIGRLRYDALFPCLVAAIVADQVTLLWGAHHTHYLIGRVFADATHALGGWMKRTFPYGPRCGP